MPKFSFLFSLGIFLTLGGFAASRELPPGCEYDKECLIELPGSECGDGTQSFFTITHRQGAQNLLVYLQGGGACWDEYSCRKGYAKPLTRVAPHINWNTGKGIFNQENEANPFRENYDIVSLYYCTGDAFAGSNLVKNNPKYQIHHKGFDNVKLAFNKIKEYFPNPKKIVAVGQSAGGIGVYYNMRALVDKYPAQPKYVLSDAGIPFKPPFLTFSKYANIIKNWGAELTFPSIKREIKKANDFSEVIQFNTEQFPNVKFGLIAAYRDTIMSFFSLAVGSPDPTTAVRKTLIEVADKHIGSSKQNQKVFYVNDKTHCYLDKNIAQTTSMGVTLSDWINDMLSESAHWDNIRPDLSSEDEIEAAYVPQSIEEAEQLK